MKYHLWHPQYMPSGAAITLEEIQRRIRANELDASWEARPEAGGDWTKVTQLQGATDPAAFPQPQQAAQIPSGTQQSRSLAILLPVIGILLLVAGAIQWSSAASQIQRAFGQTDVVAIVLFCGGAVALLIGFSFGLASPPSPSGSPPLANNSVEERLRQLDDLRAKQLISDAEHELRRRSIIASL